MASVHMAAAACGNCWRNIEPGLLREASRRADRCPGFQKLVSQAQQQRSRFSFVGVYDVKRSCHLDNDEAGYSRACTA